MVDVLSIDGGGIRGLIPALVLEKIEQDTGRPTAELFDLIAGTSTGGILACGLTAPESTSRKTEASPSPRYDAGTLADLYRERGTEIFDRSLWRKAATLCGLFDAKYDHTGLEVVLNDYFGNEPLGNSVTSVMVSAYDIQAREPYFFMSWRSPDETVPTRRAARATSAAPSYFAPTNVAVGGVQRVLVDGGVFANNPAVSAYAEARKYYPREEIRVVSIGTGNSTEPIQYGEAEEWGTLGWATSTMDIVFDGVSDAANYQLRHMVGDQFERFQVPLEAARDVMDDASPENLARLEEDAERLMELRADDLAALINRLEA